MWLMFALNLSSTKGHKIYTQFMNLLGFAFRDLFCIMNYNNPLFKLLTKKWPCHRCGSQRKFSTFLMSLTRKLNWMSFRVTITFKFPVTDCAQLPTPCHPPDIKPHISSDFLPVLSWGFDVLLLLFLSSL